MSVVRRDPLSGRCVVLSPARIPAAPAFAPGTLPVVPVCPFCPGEEARTTHTIAQRPEGVWQARAFPNRYPALTPDLTSSQQGGLFQAMAGVGAHEVIVESRDHDRVLDPVLPLQLAADRLEDLERDHRFRAMAWFRNRCREAGSSQPHPHSQIIATPHVPARVAHLHRVQAEHPGILQGLATEDRLVLQTDRVIAFCPWAPSVPFEVCIVPRVPVAQIWHDRDTLADAAVVLDRVVAALDRWVGRAAHNVILNSASLREPTVDASWHLRILPRLVSTGGFEGWSGDTLHPIFPEQAATVIRGCLL